MFNFAVDHSSLRGLDSTFRDSEPTHMSARKSAGFGLPSYLFLHRRSIRCVGRPCVLSIRCRHLMLLYFMWSVMEYRYLLWLYFPSLRL